MGVRYELRLQRKAGLGHPGPCRLAAPTGPLPVKLKCGQGLSGAFYLILTCETRRVAGGEGEELPAIAERSRRHSLSGVTDVFLLRSNPCSPPPASLSPDRRALAQPGSCLHVCPAKFTAPSEALIMTQRPLQGFPNSRHTAISWAWQVC